MKTETTKWTKKQIESEQGFSWQAGYGAFSVSETLIPKVRHYIKHQEQHHAKMSFKDEFRELCCRHGIDVDERYVWD
jgi:hypothetical protein